MLYRELGRTGLQVSAIGFGCGSTAALFTDRPASEQLAVTHDAVEGGINFFDTAFRYGVGASESNLGTILRELGDPEVIVASKIRIDPPDFTDIRASVRAHTIESLARLGRSRLDLLQLHNRVCVDDVTEPEYVGVISLSDLFDRGLVDAMESLIEEDLVGSIGFSGLGDPVAVSQIISSGRFSTLQAYYNLLNPSAGMRVPPGFRYIDYSKIIDEAEVHHVGVIGIRALAAGALTNGTLRPPGAGSWGEWAHEELEADRLRASRLITLQRGSESLSQTALRFALANERIASVAIGFQTRTDVADALEVARSRPEFSDGELAKLRSTLECS